MDNIVYVYYIIHAHACIIVMLIAMHYCCMQQLQKQIGQKIEQEVTQRASKGGTEFRILSNPQTSAAKSDTQSKKSKKGHQT